MQQAILLIYWLLTVVAGQCPPGLYPFPSSYQPSTCSPQDLCGCENLRPGAACQYSQQHMRYICCAGQAEQCGTSSSPLISYTGQVTRCQQTASDCPTGYSCMQNVCCATELNPACASGKCMNGQVYVNGQCLNRVTIGSFCQRTEQCLGGSTCVNSRCECMRGSSNVNGECVQSGSECELGMVMVNGQCESLASPGMDCMAQEQCIDHSECASNKCRCIQGYQLVNGYCVRSNGGSCPPTQTMINNRCVTFSIVGGPCLANAQCVGGSTCRNSFCGCESGYVEMFGFCIVDTTRPQCPDSEVLVNGKCTPKVPVGYPCQVSAQCLGGAQCNYGLCQCPAGQSIVNGVCSGGSGGSCTSNQVMVNGQCMPKVVIGSQCSFTQQCLGNAVCTNNYCRCPSGSTQFNGKCSSPECQQNQVFVNNQCLAMASVGGQCRYDEQCTGYSQCTNGYCRCPDGAAPTNGMCNTQNSGCKPYQVSVNNQCLDKVSIGQTCTNVAQCIVNARCSSTCECQYPTTYNGTACVNGIYYCAAGTASVSNRCLPLVQLGQSCQNSAQCMSFGMCSNGRCICNTDSININGVCRSNQEMFGCGVNEVLVGKQCYPLSQIGARCTLSQQCLGGSICQSGYCRCPANTVDNGDGVCRNGNSGTYQCASPNDEVASIPSSNCQLSGCPSDSYCYLNPQLQRYFCCRQRQPGGGSGECSNPSQSIVYENGVATNCLYAHCPSGSHCEYSSNKQQYVCCR